MMRVSGKQKFPSTHILISFFLALCLTAWVGECSAFVEDKVCGTLYSEDNLNGDKFILKDLDQSGNTRKDYRTSKEGWGSSRSVRVEENCLMTICSETYFQGDCSSLRSRTSHVESSIITPVASVNCTCATKGSCDDVIIPKNYFSSGRAYIGQGCDSDGERNFIQLNYRNKFWNFPSEWRDSVKAIVIRSGCQLITYPEEDDEGGSGSQNITTTITRNFQGRIGSYRFTCDDNKFVPLPKPETYLPLLQLPSTQSKLFALLSSKDYSSSHPGLNAALKSATNGRSSRNAYILLIGLDEPFWIDVWNCKDVGYYRIGECHVVVNLDELGVSNAQVRVIYALATEHPDIDDARWVASLENYLSSHEDLSEAIPNAVVVFHSPMTLGTVAESESRFQKKLEVVNALRGRILDENYSNLIFLLWATPPPPLVLPPAVERNPTSRLAEFESAIERRWKFPKPLFLAITARGNGHWKEPKTGNGQSKMPNEEYWPLNFQEQLLLIAEKGGDPLGHAIFKEAFPGQLKQLIVTLSNKTEVLLPEKHSKVELYLKLYTNQSALQNLSDPFKLKLERRKASAANIIALGSDHSAGDNNSPRTSLPSPFILLSFLVIFPFHHSITQHNIIF